MDVRGQQEAAGNAERSACVQAQGKDWRVNKHGPGVGEKDQASGADEGGEQAPIRSAAAGAAPRPRPQDEGLSEKAVSVRGGGDFLLDQLERRLAAVPGARRGRSVQV